MHIDLWQWFIPWEPSVTVVALTVVAAFFYVRGSPVKASIGQQLCFWLGLASLYFVSQTQFDYYAEHAFFMHRIQHSLLHHLGPFLIALAKPGARLMAGFPPAMRLHLTRLADDPFPRALIDLINQPWLACTIFCGLILFWLIPPIHFISMLDWRLYRLMNWGMALNGLMFWNLVLNNYALRPARLSVPTRIGMMLAIIPPQIIFGMLIFIAPRELYPIYSICGRAFALTPLADQQIGGMVLWIQAAIMSLIGMILLISRKG